MRKQIVKSKLHIYSNGETEPKYYYTLTDDDEKQDQNITTVIMTVRNGISITSFKTNSCFLIYTISFV